MFSAKKSDTQKGLEADRCARCGACLAFCPVYKETLIERFSPRGKNYLLRSGNIKRRQKPIKETVTACLQCGACTSLCPSGSDVSALIRRTRQDESYFQSLPPSLFGAWERLGQERSLKAVSFIERLSPVLKDFTGRINLLERPFLEHLDFYAERHAGQRVLSSYQRGVDRPRILFFTGCVQNYVYPEIASKIASLFSWDITIPKDQTCCGLAAYSQGAMKQARRFAEKNLAFFLATDFDVIVTGCASCAHMIRKWPVLFDEGSGIQKAARQASERVLELSQFVLKYDFSEIDGQALERISVQVPCHQRFGLCAPESPILALKKVLGKKGQISDKGLGCCGFGGTFSIFNPQISKKIFKSNIASHFSSVTFNKISKVVTTCSGCLLRLRQGLKREKGTPDACHLVDIMVSDKESKES